MEYSQNEMKYYLDKLDNGKTLLKAMWDKSQKALMFFMFPSN